MTDETKFFTSIAIKNIDDYTNHSLTDDDYTFLGIISNLQEEKKDNTKNEVVYKNIKEPSGINNNPEENSNKYNKEEIYGKEYKPNKEIKEENDKEEEEEEGNKNSDGNGGGNYDFFYLVYTIISLRNFINLYKLIWFLKKQEKETFKDKTYLDKIYNLLKILEYCNYNMESYKEFCESYRQYYRNKFKDIFKDDLFLFESLEECSKLINFYRQNNKTNGNNKNNNKNNNRPSLLKRLMDKLMDKEGTKTTITAGSIKNKNIKNIKESKIIKLITAILSKRRTAEILKERYIAERDEFFRTGITSKDREVKQ